MTSNHGLKISRPGYDISDPDPRNLVFHSSLNTFNIAKTGTISNTQNGGSYTFTIPHEQSFIPFIMIFHNTSAYPTYWVLDPTNGSFDNINGDKTQIATSDIRVTNTNITVTASYGNGVSETITLRYFIFNVPIA